MADTLTFLGLAREALEVAPAPMSSTELWKFAEQRGLTKRHATSGKTPWHSLGAHMYVDTKENPTSGLMRVGRRPVRFWLRTRPLPPGWSASGPSEESKQPAPATGEAEPVDGRWLEKDLHPLLAAFARTRLDGVRVKTIRHTASTKRSFGEWVHPDIVGARFPMSALDERATVEFASAIRAPLLRLFSFELKRSVDFGNLREAFFQAVSNSSWAHESYLVAAKWQTDDDEFTDELARLSQGFGIGAIHLDLEEPVESRILFPAKPRDELDWVTLDKLVAMNPDMAQFLETVRIDLNANKIHEAEYDAPPEDPAAHARSLMSGPPRKSKGSRA